MKTNTNPPTGYITIQPGPGPYDRECADIVRDIEGRLDPDETVTVHEGSRADGEALRQENARLRKVIAHLMTNPLDQREATYWTSDIDGQTGIVEIADGANDQTTIRVTEPPADCTDEK